MHAPANRTLGPARIVALVLIASLAIGLAYVHSGSGRTTVSVPAGAKAGDLILKPCTYATENGRYAADCGTLVVPENRAAPGSRLIALPVTRIHARSQHPGAPIFRLEGGPGRTNMKFSKASRLAGKHDVVLVGYRGVDGSSRLDCPEVASVLKHSADFLGDKSLRRYSAAFRECAQRLQSEGVDLAGYTLPQRVDDLEAVRSALGYGRIDLISESAGTRTAMIYSWRYPASIHRSVMVGVNPPGHFMYDAAVTDRQIRHVSALCARDDECRARTDDLAASLRRTARHIPDRWLFLPIKEGNARIAAFFGLMDSTAEAAPLSAPETVDAWLAAGEGDAGGLWFASVLADLAFPEVFVWGEVAATGIQDAPAVDAYYATGGDKGSILGNPATQFIWGGGGLAGAWPRTPGADEYRRVRTSHVETLLIGGTLDFATPPEVATDELLPHLPNGHQVVLAELGHTTDFWNYEPRASTRLLTAFFDSGKVDQSLYTHRKMDFEPDVSQPALAKGIAGAMAGLPLLMLLSLLWMARRVRVRGSFGRKASASLRSVYPAVLGFGGWFLGALIVQTTSAEVPLDDELLGVLSIGTPIGLGIYWAWVDRDWATRFKTAGFSAAMSGALMGAWLGFNTTPGLLALVTTVAGAAAGANLTVIGLDITWARWVREHRSETAAAPAEPHAVGAFK
jgi:pimeloyl-ACP methyl ester carboxylesterase